MSPPPYNQMGRKLTCARLEPLVLLLFSGIVIWYHLPNRGHTAPLQHPILARCQDLNTTPGIIVPPTFNIPKGNATLIRNATIFTGEENIIQGDILLEYNGVIQAIGVVPISMLTGNRYEEIDASGRWVTPGLVDIDTNLGLSSMPLLDGSNDLDSSENIAPWLQAIDGLNTHDTGFMQAIAGGVTSAQVIPGKTNAMGGEAFMIKLRPTAEHTPSSMIIEIPNRTSTTFPFRWRRLQQSCGESVSRHGTRLDSIWALRSAYHQARNLLQLQDQFCQRVESGLWKGEPFPENLKLELLVEALRGRVLISSHCEEAVDIDALVRLSNEFKFPVGIVQHASDAWMVTETLKIMWGGPPTVALFATKQRYNRESFRATLFAPSILAKQGMSVALKSQHPTTNSRDLLYQAQLAYYYGLPAHLALAAVTSTAAIAVGLSHRIGTLSRGSDADVVLWDRHPLIMGASPSQVWIDGIPQLSDALSQSPDQKIHQVAPEVPNWDKERNETLAWDGLPPLQGRKQTGKVLVHNVMTVLVRTPDGDLYQLYPFVSSPEIASATVVIEHGSIVCVGPADTCLARSENPSDIIDLRNGSIYPGLHTFSNSLSLEEIPSEPSTGNGKILDAFSDEIPVMLNDIGPVLRAVDALVFQTRNALHAYRYGGITSATSVVETQDSFISGISVSFGTSAAHAMEHGGILQDATALHVRISRGSHSGSVSSKIAVLRRLLYGWESTDRETGFWFKRAAEGSISFVVTVDSADIMSTLLILKAEVEEKLGTQMRMAFRSASEAHLLLDEIYNAGIGIILTPSTSFPLSWDARRALLGPPLTNETLFQKLVDRGVLVGMECQDTSNCRFDLARLGGDIEKNRILKFATQDLEKILGVRVADKDLVLYEGGGIFDMSKPIAAASVLRGHVDIF